jgi:hypothetical protein
LFLGRTAILGYEEDGGFENNSRTSFPCREGGGRGEKTACQLYAGLNRKVLQEIGDPLERRLTLWREVLNQSLWNRVAGISPPTFQDKRP